jgi:hypothetical protein
MSTSTASPSHNTADDGVYGTEEDRKRRKVLAAVERLTGRRRGFGRWRAPLPRIEPPRANSLEKETECGQAGKSSTTRPWECRRRRRRAGSVPTAGLGHLQPPPRAEQRVGEGESGARVSAPTGGRFDPARLALDRRISSDGQQLAARVKLAVGLPRAGLQQSGSQ